MPARKVIQKLPPRLSYHTFRPCSTVCTQGAPLKDSSGNPIADRIPCLKVKLLLPNWTAGAGSRNQPPPEAGAPALKKVGPQ
jgi:hypothetical protein